MRRNIQYYLKDFITSRVGWILVGVNLFFFVSLFGEIKSIQEAAKVICNEDGTRTFGFAQSSNLFFLFIFLNIFSTAAGQYLSDIIFWKFNDPCIHYTYDEYPFIYAGKFAIILLCQSIQWYLIGYGFEKLYRFAINIRDSKNPGPETMKKIIQLTSDFLFIMQ